MPNISTSNTNNIYKYTPTITLAFDENDVYIIDYLHIKGIVIDYSYDINNFPLLYVTISISKNMVDRLVEHQATGTIIFNLRKYIENGDFPGLTIDYINDKFVYFMPNSAADGGEIDDIENPEDAADITEIHTIGLISLNHINRSKKSVNGVIKKGSKSSILYYILNGHNVLLEPLQYNSVMKSTILPPMGSVAAAIKHFNNIEVFYDTPYRFFMDFDITYLTSSSGKLVERKGSLLNNVIITVRNTFDEANMEGMSTDKDLGAYVINASGEFTNIVDTSISDKGYNKISGTTSSGKKNNATIRDLTDSEITSKTSSIRIPNGNDNLIKNIEYANKLNIVSLTINSTKIDTTVLTMDKIYTINVDEVYGTDYSGQYLLTKKQEVYTPEGEGLALNIAMQFKKIPS